MIASCSMCGGLGEVGYENPVTREWMGMECPECTPLTAPLKVWPDTTRRIEDEGLTEREMELERDLDEAERENGET